MNITKSWTTILWQSTKQIWTLLNTKNWSWQNTKQTWTLLNTKPGGAQNRHEHYGKIEQLFYDGTLNRTQLHFGEPNNKHRRMFEVILIRISDFMIAIKVLLISSTLGFDKVEWFFSGSNFLYTIQYNSY